MDNNIKTSLYFKIVNSKLSLDQINKLVGLNCDRGWQKGDKMINLKGVWNGNYFNHSAWIIESKLSHEEDLDEHLEMLLKRLNPYSKKIRELPKEKSIISFGVKFLLKTPSLYFENHILKEIYGLGSDLDIDLYDMKT